MTENDFTLARGVRLHTITTDKFKMSRLSISFICDADRELSPLTKLTFSTLMRGSEKYPTVADINRRLDELYGSTVSYRFFYDGDRHVFRISCEMLDDSFLPPDGAEDILGGTLDVVKDILFKPVKDENGLLLNSFVESEKKIACDAIRAKINDQRGYAADRCRALMFDGHACGIAIDGNIEQNLSFTQKQLTDNARNILKRAQIECFYIGHKSGEEIASLLGSALNDLPEGRADSSHYGYTPYISDRALGFTEEKMPVSQGRLNIGMRSGVVMGDPDYYAACLFNEIFGGASTSKLFMNVREKKSLCYYCSSTYTSSKGTVTVSCGIKPENRRAAYDEIMLQLDCMTRGNISDEEIKTAKKTVVCGLRQVCDSPAAIEAFKFRRLMSGLDEDVTECIKHIEAVTREDILAVAKRIVPDTVYFLNGAEANDERN